jgi:hypothetical protein
VRASAPRRLVGKAGRPFYLESVSLRSTLAPRRLVGKVGRPFYLESILLRSTYLASRKNLAFSSSVLAVFVF